MALEGGVLADMGLAIFGLRRDLSQGQTLIGRRSQKPVNRLPLSGDNQS